MFALVLAAACFAAAIFLVGEVVAVPERERALSVRRAASYGARRFLELAGPGSFRERVVAPLRSWLAGLVLRVSPKTTLESVRLRLRAAGFGHRVSPHSFLAAKAALTFAGLLAGALVGGAVSSALGSVLLAIAAAGCGYLLPDLVVSIRTRSRKEAMSAQLPDALDLLAVSVEAGLSFDAAIAKLTERMQGPLVEEFELVLAEIRIGESRENALRKLAERSGVPAVAAFARAMIQADQLGISIGRLLRAQATESRLKRQAAAEERAMKAPIKMLFPTVLFIFPALFLVVLGPAFIQLFELF